MRKRRLSVVTAGLLTSVGLAIALSGCTATDPALNVPEGISVCVCDPHQLPAGFALSLKNASRAPLSIVGVSVGGSNVSPGQSWILPVSMGPNAVRAGRTPFTANRGWSQREALPRTVPAHTTDERFVSVSFPTGTQFASVQGVTVRYLSALGIPQTVKSNFRARFGPKC